MGLFSGISRTSRPRALTLSLGTAVLAVLGAVAAAAQQADQPPPGPPPMGEHGPMHHFHPMGGPGGPRGPMGGPFGPHCEDIDARRAGMLAFLHVKLGITESERPAWTQFAEAIKASDGPKRTMCESLKNAPEPATLPERLDRREQIESARLETLHALKPAIVALYQALTPQQRQIVDEAGGMLGGHDGP